MMWHKATIATLGLGASLLAFGAPAHAGTAATALPNPISTAVRYDYGSAVTLTSDGSIAVVAANAGGYGFDTPPAVYLFQYANGAWGTTPSVTICDPSDKFNSNCKNDSLPTDLFGSAVAVSANNNGTFFVVVGSPGGGQVGVVAATYGVVYEYQCTAGPPASCTLDPIATFADPGQSAGDNFGSAVAISADGNTVLVGAPGTPGPGGPGVGNATEPAVGSAYVYTTTNGNWPTTFPSVSATLSDPAPTCNTFGTAPNQQVVCDEFGYSVALSGTGSSVTALIGAPGANETITPPPNNTAKLEPGEGQAFLFGYNGTSWSPVSTFTDPNSTIACSDVVQDKCDEFGFAVALSADGTKALIAAPNEVAPGAVAGETGAVSLYMQSSGSWQGTPALTLTNPQLITGFPSPAPFNSSYTGVGGFGTSLGLSKDGTTLIVGLPESLQGTNTQDYGGTGQVDVYSCTYTITTATCPTSQTLIDPPALIQPSPGVYPSPMDYFGASVAISGNGSVWLAGAPDTSATANGEVTDNGAAYVYGTPSTAAQATLSLTLSSAPAAVATDGSFTYSFIVTDTGAVSASSLTLTDTLPAGVAFASASGGCSNATTSGSTTVTCTLAALAAGAKWQPSITVTAGATPTTTTPLQDSGSVTATGVSAVPSNTVTTTIAAPPTANSGNLETGEGMPKSGTVTGSDTDGSLTLTYLLVAGPTHGTLSPPINPTTGTFTYTPNPGYSGPDSFTFDVSNGVTTSTAATISITVSASTVTLSYTGPSGVQVTPCDANPCPTLTYTATINNTSPTVPADNLVLNVTVPSGLSLSSWTSTSGATSAACTGGSSVNCTLTTLASNASWILTVMVSVNAADTAGTSLASTASLTLSNGSSPPSVNANVTVAAGAGGGGPAGGGSSGGGSLGWLELLALGGLTWFGRRKCFP